MTEVENAKKVNSYLTLEYLQDLKDYARFGIFYTYGVYLTSAHYKALSDFEEAQMGTVRESAGFLRKRNKRRKKSWIQ